MDCLERMAIMKSKQKHSLMNEKLVEAFISFCFVPFCSVFVLFNEILLISVELLNEWIPSAGLSLVDSYNMSWFDDILHRPSIFFASLEFRIQKVKQKNWRSEKSAISWFPWNWIRAVGIYVLVASILVIMPGRWEKERTHHHAHIQYNLPIELLNVFCANFRCVKKAKKGSCFEAGVDQRK